MSSEQPPVLGDLLLETKDGDWGKGEPSEGLLPYHVIRATDFAAASLGQVHGVPLRFLRSKTVQRRTLRANDILIETAGGSPGRPTGRTMLVTQNVLDAFDGPVTCASFARFMRPDPNLIDARYLYWFLKSLYQSGEIEQHQVQHTGVARFQYTKFAAKQRVPLPSKEEQRAIAEVLGGLDDKIAANTKLAETTDQLARLVYTSILADATEIPLSKTAEFVNGKAFTKGASGTGRVVVRIAELNSGIGGSTVYSDAEVDDKHTARAGDLLFAWSGSLTLHRWYREDAIINQHIFKVIPRDDYPLWLVDQLLQSKIGHFKAVAADKATTMGHIQRRHLDEPVLVPSPEAIRANSVLMEGLWNLGLLAEQENEKLAATRDALLPQLMSGQLRVSDL